MMRLLENASLRRKLMIIIMATALSSLTLAALGFLISDAIGTRRAMRNEIVIIGRMISELSNGTLTFDDPDEAAKILRALQDNPYIVSATIFTLDGKEFASFRRAGHTILLTREGPEGGNFVGDYLEFRGPIILEGETLGSLALRSNLSALRQRRSQFVVVVFAIVLASAFFALLISSGLQRVISRPILNLAQATRAVSRDKNYSVRVEGGSKDELGELIDGFNEMLREIQTRDAALEAARLGLEKRVDERTAELQQEVVERRQAEEQLRQTAMQLERSNKELQAFAYVASHDLQEPLRKVQAFADRLKLKYKDALGDEGRDYLDRMENAARRMQALIEDLLQFSRVTTKASPFEKVDLNRIAREVLSDLEVRVQQTQARVELGDLPSIEADSTQMRQLFQNLLGNALKFRRPEEPPHVRIQSELVLTRDGENNSALCRLSVTDNGIGFDEKYSDRIFAVFQRLHARSTYEGTGIGLAICRKITERHGGTIYARSTPGRGSTFIVTLPVRQPKKPA